MFQKQAGRRTVKHLSGKWGILANEPCVTQPMSPSSRVSFSHLPTEWGSTKSLFPQEFCAGDRVRQEGFNTQSPMSHLRDAGSVGGGVSQNQLIPTWVVVQGPHLGES